MTTTLRPMTLGELLDRTFQLYRRHFLVFVGIATLPALAAFVVQLLSPSAAGQLNTVSGSILWTFGGALLTFVASTVAQGATVVAVSNLHLDRPTSIALAFGAIKGRVVDLCAIALIVGLLMGLGFMLLIIPGIILALRWSLVIPVAIVEHGTVGEVRARSATLTEGARLRVLMVYVLFFVATVIITSIWALPIGVMAGVSVAQDTAVDLQLVRLLSAVGQFFAQLLSFPLMNIAIALIYYDQRVRHEAFDLEHMMAQLDGPPGSAQVPS